MEIDLNNPQDFTIQNVRKIIASGDDSINTQYRVTDKGILFISKVVGNSELDGIKFRLETNGAYNNYVGEKAANNSSWVKRIYEVVKENWPNPASSYIDNF